MTRERIKISIGIVIAVAAACAPAYAVPTTYDFTCITNNNAANAAAGESQLFVDVSSVGGQVEFKFRNEGPVASSICDIYFDDGVLLSIASINEGPGTSFSSPATPPNLPGGNSITPHFDTTAGFSADSDAGAPGVMANGVNPDEWVAILFSLQGGKTLDDVLDDLASGALRIGIHVQGFPNGGSESFVNDGGNNVVPVPGAILMCALGIACVGWSRQRRLLDRA